MLTMMIYVNSGGVLVPSASVAHITIQSSHIKEMNYDVHALFILFPPPPLPPPLIHQRRWFEEAPAGLRAFPVNLIMETRNQSHSCNDSKLLLRIVIDLYNFLLNYTRHAEFADNYQPIYVIPRYYSKTIVRLHQVYWRDDRESFEDVIKLTSKSFLDHRGMRGRDIPPYSNVYNKSFHHVSIRTSNPSAVSTVAVALATTCFVCNNCIMM